MIFNVATLQVFHHSTIKCCGFLALELGLDLALLYVLDFLLTGLDFLNCLA